jgi:exonuclease VII large subunit
VALGHATDDLVVARVADASFPTPTALGAWLRDTLQQKRLQARQLEEARLLTESKELLQQLGKLQQAQGAAAWWRALAVVLAVLWLGTVAW